MYQPSGRRGPFRCISEEENLSKKGRSLFMGITSVSIDGVTFKLVLPTAC